MFNYEIVELEEKVVTGIEAGTNNFAPDMGAVIGGLWQSFFEKGIYHGIPNKKNGKALGIYTDYAGTEKDDYTVMVACEVNTTGQAKDGVTVERVIPAGKYAKFVVTGDAQQAAAAFWQSLWKMELSRTFAADFEEYQNSDMEQAEIHIYIGIK